MITKGVYLASPLPWSLAITEPKAESMAGVLIVPDTIPLNDLVLLVQGQNEHNRVGYHVLLVGEAPVDEDVEIASHDHFVIVRVHDSHHAIKVELLRP